MRLLHRKVYLRKKRSTVDNTFLEDEEEEENKEIDMDVVIVVAEEDVVLTEIVLTVAVRDIVIETVGRKTGVLM